MLSINNEKPDLSNCTYNIPRSLPNIDYNKIFKLGIQVNGAVPYERASLERCKDLFIGSTFFDIGANYGLWSHAALQCSASRVIAFEYSKDYAKILRKNLKKFPQERWTVIEGFVFDKRDNYVNPDTGVKVEAISIDYFLSQFHPGMIKPTFMKIDVEGGELAVLMGAEKTIRKYKPSLMIEVHEMYVPSSVNLIMDLVKDYLGLDPISYQYCHKDLYHLYYDARPFSIPIVNEVAE